MNYSYFLTFWNHPLCGVVVFLLGASLGSFFNVCVTRIPAGQSVIWPGSHCDCGQKIPFFLNIPLVSWLFLKGRARCCGRTIGFQYFFYELFSAILWTLLWLQTDFSGFCVGSILFSILIVASGIDLATMEIPDRFTIGGAVAGIFVSGIAAHYVQDNYIFLGIFSSIKGMLIGSSTLLWIALISEAILKKETVGFGDVKLMGCIGSFIGCKGALFSIFGGSFLGTLLILPFLIWKNKQRGDNVQLGSVLPYGPFLALGAISYYLFFQKTVDSYFAQLEILLR